MSRGFGKWQRAILAVYDQAVPQPRGLQEAGPDTHGLPGWYHARDVKHHRWLRLTVVQQLGGWCETECRAPAWRREPHRPHLSYGVLGEGFHASFSHALHSLVRQDILASVTWEGAPRPLGRGRRITYVARQYVLPR